MRLLDRIPKRLQTGRHSPVIVIKSRRAGSCGLRLAVLLLETTLESPCGCADGRTRACIAGDSTDSCTGSRTTSAAFQGFFPGSASIAARRLRRRTGRIEAGLLDGPCITLILVLLLLLGALSGSGINHQITLRRCIHRSCSGQNSADDHCITYFAICLIHFSYPMAVLWIR